MRRGMDEQSWQWCGSVRKEGSEGDVYTIASIDGEHIRVCVSDDAHTFAGKITLGSQTNDKDSCKSGDIAEVGSDCLLRLVQESFGSTGTRPSNVRVVQHAQTGDLQLRVCAQWGEEYGHHAVHLDILSVNLQRQSHNEHFLQTLFTSIVNARKQLVHVEQSQQQLQIQFQDASEALQRIERANTVLRAQRVQVFLDALNRHKVEAAAMLSSE